MVDLPAMLAWRSGSAIGVCSGSTMRYGGFASNASLALWEHHG
jgi:hypothetical protein